MEVCTLFSGSSGNSTYIKEGKTEILVDTGVSYKALSTRLRDIGTEMRNITAVLITHGHSDHIRAARLISRRHDMPMMGRMDCMTELFENGHCDMPDRLTAFSGPGPFAIGDLLVSVFDTPHDACGSCGYRFENGRGKSAAVATDLGCVTEAVWEGVRGVDVAVIEANHDTEMLMYGPYPRYLKERVMSDRGHLSNDVCGELALELVRTGTPHLLLAHLSKVNNMPGRALEAICGSLAAEGVAPGDVTVDVAPRDEASPVFRL